MIRAPFAGRVGLRRVSVGSLINPGAGITTLEEIEEKWKQWILDRHQAYLGRADAARKTIERADALRQTPTQGSSRYDTDWRAQLDLAND